MKCQLCDNPATVHLTDFVNGKKKETHLCKGCAEKQQFIKHQEMNLSGILQSVLGQYVGQESDELARLTCPACGIKYMEFKAEGRLGCPQDYEIFRSPLLPLLERIHRSLRHVGKAPRHGPTDQARQAEILELRRKLRRAIEAEAYEEAARMRDLLRQKEANG